MKLKVLILGSSGLVGSSLIRHLNSYDILDITLTYHKNFPKEFTRNKKLKFNCLNFDKNTIIKIFSKFDFILNCIIDNNNFDNLKDKHKRFEFFKINSVFPRLLGDIAKKSKTKVIHLSSDAVFSGTKGTAYTESDDTDPVCIYGVSKLLGEQDTDNMINIRSSFIGNSPYKKNGLIEWLDSFKNDETIYGFNDYIWSGVTTLQLSQFLYNVLNKNLFYDLRKYGPILNLYNDPPLSKFELLVLISNIFKKELNILEKNNERPVNRSLKTENPVVKELNKSQASLESSIYQLYLERTSL
jgi:dTDP-4-dehydrorhamnose reductase